MYSLDEKEKRYICTKPFQWLEIGENGQCWLCCPEWLKTPIGTLGEKSIDEIWNGKEAQEIRNSMYDGSFKYCNDGCPFKNTRQGPVKQINKLIEEQPKFKTLIDNKLTILPYHPKQINAAYDKSCNLSCPSCRTRVIIETGNNKQKINEIQQEMKLAAKDLEWLCITGSGDPFGSPTFKKLLREFDDKEFPKLKAIHLHTNAILWDKEMWDSMPAVHKYVKSAEISIDAATKETYEINRRGGNWNKLLANLDWISTLNINIKISMVVQKNNFKEMPEFVKLGREKYDFTVYFSKLANWNTYKDYDDRAIHLKSHPDHAKFTNMLNNDIFKQSKVILGNLSDIPNLYQLSRLI